MRTIKSRVSETLREKGSKFIGYLYPVRSVEAFEKKLKQVISKHPDATHHCYAYRIDPNSLQEYTQDDGEPGGTAGFPILNQLKSYDVVNAALIVVRYFGGTKLGKSGLIQAYGDTAELCIEQVGFERIRRTENIQLIYPYDRQNQVDRLKSNLRLVELDSEYLEVVTLVLACPLENTERMFKELKKLQHQGIRYRKLGKDFVSG